MIELDWPTDGGRAFALSRYTERAEWNVEIAYARNQRLSTRALPGMRWVAVLQVPPDSIAFLRERRQLEALLMRLRGGAGRLRIWNLVSPEPLGTMRGTPTLTSTAAANATSVAITGTGTLLRGDRIGLGVNGQRVMVTADATLPATVSVEPALRVAVAAATAVVWDKPTSSYTLRNAVNEFPAEKTRLPGFDVELVEE